MSDNTFGCNFEVVPATMGDQRWPKPTQSELAILYGNPYYGIMRPGHRTLLFNEWGLIGFNKGFVNYPSFVDAKSGYIIVSERDNHRLQIFDNVGAPSRFDRYVATAGVYRYDVIVEVIYAK